MGFSDQMELYRIDKQGNWNLEVKTNNAPNLLQKILCKLGLINYAGDYLTNYLINDVATHLGGKYLYVSVGTSDTGSSDYTLNALSSQVMGRVASTNTYILTYGTDPAYPDTTVFTAIITSDGDYDLLEAGLHTTSTGGYMGARQTFSTWSVTSGEVFGIIWRIINNRG